MRTISRSSLFLGAALVASMALGTLAEETKPTTEPLRGEKTVLVTVTAKVEAIDQAKREVTLKGPLGNVVTFAVDERVKRLNEVHVGDEVTADYYVSLAGELRTPTEEEKNHPLTIIDGAARAPNDTSPAAGAFAGSRSSPKSSALICRPNRSRWKARWEIRGPFASSRLRSSNNFASTTPSSSPTPKRWPSRCRSRRGGHSEHRETPTSRGGKHCQRAS